MKAVWDEDLRGLIKQHRKAKRRAAVAQHQLSMGHKGRRLSILSIGPMDWEARLYRYMLEQLFHLKAIGPGIRRRVAESPIILMRAFNVFVDEEGVAVSPRAWANVLRSKDIRSIGPDQLCFRADQGMLFSR